MIHTVDDGRTDSDRRFGRNPGGEWTLCGARIEYATYVAPAPGSPACPKCEALNV